MWPNSLRSSQCVDSQRAVCERTEHIWPHLSECVWRWLANRLQELLQQNENIPECLSKMRARITVRISGICSWGPDCESPPLYVNVKKKKKFSLWREDLCSSPVHHLPVCRSFVYMSDVEMKRTSRTLCSECPRSYGSVSTRQTPPRTRL